MKTRRAGTSLVETLLAAVLALVLAGCVAGAMWSWARSSRLLDARERALSLARSRLELLTSLPADRRPGPGSYQVGDADGDPDLGRVLATESYQGASLTIGLVVEERPVRYPDYYFGTGEPIPYLDLHVYRIRVEGARTGIELAVLK